MPKRDQKAQSVARASRRITVDREEYHALCALRDGVHEELRGQYAHLDARHRDLVRTNHEQLSRLTKLSLEYEHLRVCLTRVEQREALVTARAAALEPQVSEAKNALADAQGTIARLTRELEEVRARLATGYVPFGTPQPAFGGGK